MLIVIIGLVLILTVPKAILNSYELRSLMAIEVSHICLICHILHIRHICMFCIFSTF